VVSSPMVFIAPSVRPMTELSGLLVTEHAPARHWLSLVQARSAGAAQRALPRAPIAERRPLSGWAGSSMSVKNVGIPPRGRPGGRNRTGVATRQTWYLAPLHGCLGKARAGRR